MQIMAHRDGHERQNGNTISEEHFPPLWEQDPGIEQMAIRDFGQTDKLKTKAPNVEITGIHTQGVFSESKGLSVR
jgi:hypothetical protein